MNKIYDYTKRIGILIGSLVLFLIGPSLVAYFLKPLGLSTDSVLLLVICNTVIFIILGLIFIKDLVKDFKDFKVNYKKHLKFGIKCWAIGLGVMMVSNLIINFVIFGGDKIAGNEEAARTQLLTSPILGMISAAILAPLTEELTFRMGFRKVFKRMLPFAFASTFVFAGLHVITDFSTPLDLLYFIPYGSLGFAFAIAYYKTNNIFTSISLHMMHNFFTFGLIIITYLGV